MVLPLKEMPSDPPTQTTLPSCPSCKSPMVLHVLPACHERPGVSFHRCVDCGAEDGHRIDPATPSIASPGAVEGGPAMMVHAGTRR